jgi:hypothetical protein
MTNIATVPTLLVFMDADGFLHWKPDDVKGARWKSAKTRDIGKVCNLADEVMGDRYNIEYVDQQEAA